jgi:opacity protein-like surface antigen
LIGSSFLVSTGSMAADLPVKAPPKAVWADSWAGPYIGAYFGAGAGQASESVTRTSSGTSAFGFNNVVSVSTTNNQTSTGRLAGDVTGSMVDLFAGYNWRTGNFVVGGQVEGTLFSDVTAKTIGTETFNEVVTQNGTVNFTNSGFDTVENHQQLRSRAGLIGRIGFLATPDVLLYGLGGLELGHFVYPDGVDRFGGSNGKWVAGYTVGAGGEVRLTDHWSLRGEYRYLNFDVKRNEADGSASTNVQGGVASTSSSNNATARQIRADFNLGKIGLVYRFGSGPVSAMAAMPVKAAARTACCDSWAGVYVGAYFGSGKGRAKETLADTENFVESFGQPIQFNTEITTRGGNLAGNTTGSMVDLFAGYNWRAGNFVVGGQVEGTVFSDVTLKTSGIRSTTILSNFGTPATQTSTDVVENRQQLRSMVGLIGRAGYLATPKLLLYGLGGLELGHFVYPDGTDPFGGRNGQWAAGFAAGAGGEYKLTDHWSLRGEYRYVHFNVNRDQANSSQQTFTDTSGIPTITTSDEAVTRRIAADIHFGKIGVAYRFCYCD